MILMNDFAREPAELIQAQVSAAERVFRSGWYILGNEVKAFEERWATLCGTSHAIGVGNGLDAIEIALRALAIGPGDEVITTPVTAFATTLAVLRVGATPVFADIDPGTGLLDPSSARTAFSLRTKAILPVHLYGQTVDLPTFSALAQENHIHLIEDCAQAHLATYDGRPVGSWGVCGAFSFYPTKNLGAVGDGGALVCSDQNLAQSALMLRNYGQSVRYYHPVEGLNSRLDELQAAILSCRLEWLGSFTARRRAVARLYDSGIHDTRVVRKLSKPADLSRHVYHLYVVVARDEQTRQRLQAHLDSVGVQTHIHYPVPIPHQKGCTRMRTVDSGIPNALRHAQCCLSLPCHPGVTDDEVAVVVEAVNSFARHG